MRLTLVRLRSPLLHETLGLKARNRLGDCRRPHAKPLRENARREAVLDRKFEHDRILPGIKAVAQEPRGKRCSCRAGHRLKLM